jgi:arginyl-tRNA synthetase
MKSHLEGLLRDALDRAVAAGELRLGRPPVFAIEVPSDVAFGDLATNVAMVLAREAGRPPRVLAEIILRHVHDPQGWLAGTEVAGPGFINFRLAPAFWRKILAEALTAGAAYGRTDVGRGRRMQIEFVSANPTGPLHVGHGRGAVLGDVTARLLEATGWDVEREYYINDFGRQMGLLGESTWARYQQACGRDVPLPEGGYPGEYLVDVARRVREEHGDALLAQPAEEAVAFLRTAAAAMLLDLIRDDLTHFRVRFDRFVSERGLHEAGAFDEALAALPPDLLYRDDGALFFRTTRFGDEKDRAVVRGNGEPTYFGGDVAHYRGTLAGGFERLINVLGADHHGYIARLRAIIAGFGASPDMLRVLLVQLVNLTRGGEPVRMGKRAGEFVTLRDVIDEVGVDAARFFFLLRKADSTLDFDLELAKKQHTDNPVFYVQYAHARIASVLRQAEAGGIVPDAQPALDALGPPEVDAVRVLAGWPEVVDTAARELEPHRIVFYCQELAATFHRYYNQHRIITEDAALTQTRLALVRCIQQVLRSALGLAGVTAPERM